jgi:3-hydroxyisobutyrate dehydrogenase-like beta-hydroxyacid dehydrogenase
MIGLGIMGSAMSANLVRAGFEVHGYDIVPAARRKLRAVGGKPCRSAAEVARRCEIVITSLPSSAALAAVAEELAGAKLRGRILVETSTLPLEDKLAARKILAAAGVTALDCPLSGTGAQARTRDLVVYASGPKAAYARCRPVFDGFARAHHRLGPFGHGSKMKFVANLLVAIHNVSAGEAVTLARKAGLDPLQVYRVVGDGAGGSRMLQVRGPMMVAEDYSDATMKVEVWQKDMAIIGAFAAALDCPTPLFSAAAPIYTAAMASGHAREDTASVCAVLGEMAGIPSRAKRRARR